MTKLLLVYPTYYEDNEQKNSYSFLPPLGLGYLASSARTEGCDVKIFDVMGREQELIQLIKEYQPDIIGLSSMTTSYPGLKDTIELIRNNGYNGKLIAGGPHITLEPEKTLKQLKLDACIIGDGEESIREMIRFDDWSNIKGLYLSSGFTLSREKIKDLDIIQFPAFDLFELDKYEYCINENILPVIPSRGCPYNCIFCSSKHLEGVHTRFRSPDNLVEEMKQLKQTYGINKFMMYSDTFVSDKKWVTQFSNLIEHEDISFRCNGRINVMTKELLNDLKRAGCYQIDYGVESIVQSVSNVIKKSINVNDVEKIVKLTTSFGIITHLYFMLSLPGESLDDMKETIAFAKKMELKYGSSIEFQITRIYPGTPLAEIAGLNKNDWAEVEHKELRYPNVPCYLEHPLEQVYDLWQVAHKRKSFGAKIIFVGNRFAHGDSKKEVIRWLIWHIKNRCHI